MDPIVIIIVVVVAVAVAFGVFFFLKKRSGTPVVKKKKHNISEWSYQRFAKFYGFDVLPDPEFSNKLDKIKKFILHDKLESIEEIANKSGCTFDECVLKIKYLKNKRVIGDYVVDKINNRVRPCNDEELKLIQKYGDLVYAKHYQVSDMAKEVPNYHNMPLAILREDIFKDIKYMNDRVLLNGIKLNEDERRIIYYTLEKHEKSETYDTLNCTSCGMLIDVLKDGMASCPNCGTVIKGSNNKTETTNIEEVKSEDTTNQ